VPSQPQDLVREKIAQTITQPSPVSMLQPEASVANLSGKPSSISLQSLSSTQSKKASRQVQPLVQLSLVSASCLQPENSIKPANSAPITTQTPAAVTTNLTQLIQVDRPCISLETLQEELKTSLAEALYMERSEVDIDKTFIDLGLDSIIGVEWIKAVNKQYGTDIPATKVYDYPNLREFAGFIQTELSRQAGQIPGAALTPEQPAVKAPVSAVQLPPVELVAGRLSSLEPDRDVAPMSRMSISLETLQEELRTSLAETLYMERSEVDIEKTFIDLGLDSIIGVEWVKVVNKQYGTAIPATKVYDYPSVREFARFVATQLPIAAPALSIDEILNQVYQGTLDAKAASALLEQLQGE
jgi:acyl carrier protein